MSLLHVTFSTRMLDGIYQSIRVVKKMSSMYTPVDCTKIKQSHVDLSLKVLGFEGEMCFVLFFSFTDDICSEPPA